MRYNETTAYAPHFDYIREGPKESDHNWDSENGGSNRYATLLIYLNHVEEGGQTVFPEAPLNNKDLSQPQASREAEENEFEAMFPIGSWEREMIADCRSRLAVNPNKLEAILFYHQTAAGAFNPLSLHGGCPVIKVTTCHLIFMNDPSKGVKYAANLWIWNGPRVGTRKNDGSEESQKLEPVSASFESKVVGASLYWGDQHWEVLVKGRSVKVSTFAGHEWNAFVNGDLVKTWIISQGKKAQRFVLTANDLPEYN